MANNVNMKKGESVRKKSALEISSIMLDLALSCGCERNCNTKITTTEVLEIRKKYHTKPRGFEKHLELMQLYKSSLFQEKYGEVLHMINGKLVCKQFWYSTVVKVSRCTYQRMKKMIKKGIANLEKPTYRSLGERGQVALGFMELYVSLHSDACPDSDGLVLAQGIGIKDAYDQYCETYRESERIQLAYFYKIWKKHFPHVHQRKFSRFTKCHVCLLSKYILSQNLNPQMEVLVRKDRDEHLKRQELERKAYYERRADAVRQPDKIVSMILDAMDQSKTNIPHLKGWQKPKTLDESKLLQTHVIGAILHGKRTFFFLDVVQWPHDSNLTINTLLNALALEYRGKELPKILFVQLDNCGRENKNKYFLGMMALLVRQGYFKEIVMSFLMVGHTHEDIDGRFSRVSVALRKKDAKTLPQLKQVLDNCLKNDDELQTEMIPAVFNIRDWIEPCLNNIHDHSKPHVYRFFIDKPNHVAMQYKLWSTDQNWLPKTDQPPLEIFKIDEITKLQQIPTEVPDIIDPDFERKQNFADIKQNIEKNQGYLSYEERGWWEEFLESPEDHCCKQIDWYLDVLRPCINSSEAENIETSATSGSPLAIPMEKERTVPLVQTGRKLKRRRICEQSDITETATVPVQATLNLQEGYMILFKENGEYGIGEVHKNDIGQDSVQVHLYQGSLNGEWKPLRVGDQYVVKRILKSLITDRGIFLLTRNKCLPKEIKSQVKTILS